MEFILNIWGRVLEGGNGTSGGIAARGVESGYGGQGIHGIKRFGQEGRRG